MAARSVLQFKVTLLEVEPAVWRRIQISDLCSFWDLHVAIQDAMGWTDSHLHEFEMKHSIEKGKQYLGIPDDGYDDFHNTLPGAEGRVRDHLIINDQFMYRYDFGDGWEHRTERQSLLAWMGGAFDPEKFDPKEVKFDSPSNAGKLHLRDNVFLLMSFNDLIRSY